MARAKKQERLEARSDSQRSLFPITRLCFSPFSSSSIDDKPTLKVLITGLAPRPVSQPLNGSEAPISAPNEQATTTFQELVLPADATMAEVYGQLRASGESWR